jgi:hypothetical protein
MPIRCFLAGVLERPCIFRDRWFQSWPPLQKARHQNCFRRAALLAALSLPLAQPHARAGVPVLVDEDHTGGFQGTADGQVVGGSH